MEDEHVDYISDEELFHIVVASELEVEGSHLREEMGNLVLANQSNPESQQPQNGEEPSGGASGESFNEDLPAVHSYLGDNLEQVSGRVIYSENRYVTIPLLSGIYATLLPGQTFPLTVRDFDRAEMLRKCVEGDHTFGCLAARNPAIHLPIRPSKNMHGTIAEIYEFSDERGTVSIKARGRQRFKVVRTRKTENRYRMAEVIILPEVKLQHPFNALQLASLNTLRISHKEKCRRIEANFMAWPKWVYDMYDTEKLVKKAEKLTFLKRGLRTDKDPTLSLMPKDPSELSFWIAAHLDIDKRLLLLSLNSPIPRLRWMLGFLRKHHQYLCIGCESVIGKQHDVFAMSVEGAQSTYVNAEGYHHDTLTLLKADNIVPISSPSTHFSWFPGYAWRIAVCRQCQKHLGWLFIATKKSLRPSRFWGLTRQALYTLIGDEDESFDPDDMPFF